MIDIISKAQIEANLADNIVSRTHEVYSYNLNIKNYELLIASIGELEWPERLLPFRFIDSHAAAAQVSSEDIDLISILQQLDQAKRLLASETVEHNKAKRILDILDPQLTGANRDTAIADAITRRNQLTQN